MIRVLQHWNIKATLKHAAPALDYITMNKNAARQGIISPKLIRGYREQHPVRVRVGDHFGIVKSHSLPGSSNDTKKAKGSLPSDLNPHFTYGKPTRYAFIHSNKKTFDSSGTFNDGPFST